MRSRSRRRGEAGGGRSVTTLWPLSRSCSVSGSDADARSRGLQRGRARTQTRGRPNRAHRRRSRRRRGEVARAAAVTDSRRSAPDLSLVDSVNAQQI